MFSAKCYQKAKNMYAKINRETATIITYYESNVILCCGSGLVPEKREATVAMINAIDGRIAPAQRALKVPMYNKALSLHVI